MKINNLSTITLILLMFMLPHCGGKKSNGSGSEPAPTTGTTPDDNANLPDDEAPGTVSGSLSLASGVGSLAGFNLLVVETSTGFFKLYQYDSDGKLEFAAQELTAGKEYQFFILDNELNYLTGLDFVGTGEKDAPTPIAFSGKGGLDLGEITLYYDNFGSFDQDKTLNKIPLGSGFTLSKSQGVALGQILPEEIESLKLSQGLVVPDENILLQHFQNSTVLKRLFSEYNSYGIEVTKKSDSILSFASLKSAGKWLKYLKNVTSFNQSFSKAKPWVNDNYVLTKESDGNEFSSRFYSPIYPLNKKIATLNFTTVEGEMMEMVIDFSFSNPFSVPKLLKKNLDGTVDVTIDYLDNLAQNGLSNPFCLDSADLSLTFSAPTYLDGTAFSQFTAIKSLLEYYSDEFEQVKPTDADFPSDWQQKKDQSVSLGNSSWDPDLASYSISLSSSEQTKTSHVISMPVAIFLTAIPSKNKNIKYYKLWINYLGTGLDTAIPVWFKRC